MKETYEKLDYHTAKAIRSALASEIARRVKISDELIEAKIAADAAVGKFRDMIRKAIDEQRGEY